jgi:iron complex transport system ATP-binding protein
MHAEPAMDPPRADAEIEITGLVCRFGAAAALEGVSFTIPSGTLCGIVGPNGAGKTTLLRVIAGTLGPRAGVVAVAGRDPLATPAPELARLMAVLPQRPVAPSGITVREAVAWGRGPHLGRLAQPGAEDLRAVDEALADARIVSLADRPLETLSGGELHQALIARALAQRPRILLMDEPTVHLDLTHQVEVMELLRRLTARGVTVVAVLHDLNLAAAYCDPLALLARGRLLGFGAPSTVIRADLIARAYGTVTSVRANPATGRPYVVATAPVRPRATGPRVHVIAGGGAGSELITRCVAMGFRVSVGVVHVMDSDDETARALDLRIVEEAPFSPVGEETTAAAAALARASDAVVVAPVPVGVGNLRNLEVAAAALAHGVPVVIVGGLTGRDFTGGIATRRVGELVEAGARLVPDVPSAIEALRRAAVVEA